METPKKKVEESSTSSTTEEKDKFKQEAGKVISEEPQETQEGQEVPIVKKRGRRTRAEIDAEKQEALNQQYEGYKATCKEFVKFFYNGLIAGRLGKLWELTPEEEEHLTFFYFETIKLIVPVDFMKYSPIAGLIFFNMTYGVTRYALMKQEKKTKESKTVDGEIKPDGDKKDK